MRRREFIILLGGLTAIPLTARAQQAAMPVIGYLSANTPEGGESRAAAFRRGLQESGYVVGQNVAIEYHWAGEQIDQLPLMAADLVKRHVTVIAAVTTPAALAAQAATTTIPIVFESGSDPVRLGLVTNLNQPGGNVTGATSVIVEIGPKRLELLHELLPTAKVMGLLVNPADRALAQSQAREILSAARNRKLELHVLNVRSESDFDTVFADIKRFSANRSATASAHLPPKSPSCRGITQDFAKSFSGQHGQPKYLSKRTVSIGKPTNELNGMSLT